MPTYTFLLSYFFVIEAKLAIKFPGFFFFLISPGVGKADDQLFANVPLVGLERCGSHILGIDFRILLTISFYSLFYYCLHFSNSIHNYWHRRAPLCISHADIWSTVKSFGGLGKYLFQVP